MANRTIERFLDDSGRVAIWPSRGADRALVLQYLAQVFQPGLTYNETEVNSRLVGRHTWNDPAFLRRMLYSSHLLNRTPDGSQYWREER